MVDANHPYKASQKYICSFKIVDPSLNIRHTPKPSSKPATKGSSSANASNSMNYSQVIFYANSPEQLPHVPRVGDIVRIHRAKLREFNKVKQFNVNLFFRSSYLLFHLDPQAAMAASKEEAKSSSGSKRQSEKLIED